MAEGYPSPWCTPPGVRGAAVAGGWPASQGRRSPARRAVRPGGGAAGSSSLSPGGATVRFLDRDGFDALLRTLSDGGYELIGPTVRDGAIVLDPIDGVRGAPRRRRRDPGSGHLPADPPGGRPGVRLGARPRCGQAVPVPAPRVAGDDPSRRHALRPRPRPTTDKPFAFVGLRSCDLHAIAVQDQVFMDLDPAYRRRREAAVFIGVNCEVPGGTCFCDSMDTGPRCTIGFDLALTELDDGFVVDVGTPRGGGAAGRASRDARGHLGRGGRVGARHRAGARTHGSHARDLRHAGPAVPQP